MFLLFCLSCACIILIGGYVGDWLNVEVSYDYPPEVLFFFAVITAPLFETLFFQFLIIGALQALTKIGLVYIVLISAAVFGVAHLSHLFVIINASLMGIVLGFCYVIFQKRFNRGYLYTALLHSLVNLAGWSIWLVGG